MGMIAANMAEVVERSANDLTKVVYELQSADMLSVHIGADGLVWINIDGVLALRVQYVRSLELPDTE